MSKKQIKIIIGTSLLVIGIIILLISMSYKSSDTKIIENAIETTATITNITPPRNETDSGIVMVLFKVKGENFKVQYDKYSDDLKIGQTVTIYYDIDNPYNIKSVNAGGKPYIFIAIGIVLVIVGGSQLIIPLIEKKKGDVLQTSGLKVWATFEDTIIDNTVSENGNHPHKIICSITHPKDNKIYMFTSVSVWFNVKEYFTFNPGTRIPVYVQKDDFTKYHVDTDYLKNIIGK